MMYFQELFLKLKTIKFLKIKEKELLTILDEENVENFFKSRLILDEMNLASSQLLEYLYNYLNSKIYWKNCCCYYYEWCFSFKFKNFTE